MKLLIFITSDIRDAVNTWIEKNIAGAGANTFFATYTKDATLIQAEVGILNMSLFLVVGDKVDYYAAYWRIGSSDKDKLVAYLEANHAKKYSYEYIDDSNKKAAASTMASMHFDKNNVV